MNGVTKNFVKPKTEDYGKDHETVMKPSFNLCSASPISCDFIDDAKKHWNMWWFLKGEIYVCLSSKRHNSCML